VSDVERLALGQAAELAADEVMRRLATSPAGLDDAEAQRRAAMWGANAVRSHGARPLAVLLRQLRSPLLVLLVLAASVSVGVGQRTDALIILAIVSLSAGLGFLNEYRSERAVEELHSRIRHRTTVRRGGTARQLDVTDLVAGDLIHLDVGDVVPADVRLVECAGLECDESVLTGESAPAEKDVEPVRPPHGPLELSCCALMGTVVRAGTASAVVVGTGSATAFGAIAMRLGERPAETAFQHGLRDFSMMLVWLTAALTVAILVLNAALRHSFLESLLFALAIAVGLTPQLLPAIVTISLSAGARRMARRGAVVKRLVTIEDLGNVEVLFTDKTGTLTEGHISFARAVGVRGEPCDEALRLGLLCNQADPGDTGVATGNALDRALHESPQAAAAQGGDWRRITVAPFDHERRLMSVLAASRDGRCRVVVTKGAPEAVLQRCVDVPGAAQDVLAAMFRRGERVIAVATRPVTDNTETLSPADERDLHLAGYLSFVDPPKRDAGIALRRLQHLGVQVRLVTGDNGTVAEQLCRELHIPVGGVVSGDELDAMSDSMVRDALARTTIFARVTPDQKSRIIRAQRSLGVEVGFLGDGVNDAVALHDADVGISVEGASDVARDAADIVLLEKDLGILAGAVMEGRRIFSNTVKYVLMATSSNFGNMFSAAGASLFLAFLPMLPTQVLLNNLLYDVGEMTIPTDAVDEEMLRRPAHWDIGMIRRFMAFFGPISSVFDFLTFGIMLWVFHAGASLFQTGWFVESLCTQTLVIFVIRTRRVPFLRSRPSRPLLLTTLACAATAVALPFTPVRTPLGFTALPLQFLGMVAGLVVVYLALVEAGKTVFARLETRRARPPRPLIRRPAPQRRLERLAPRWSSPRLDHR
jgi:Mg2+-importing ATPase